VLKTASGDRYFSCLLVVLDAALAKWRHTTLSILDIDVTALSIPYMVESGDMVYHPIH
jgi:hypothetical protein